MEKKMKRFKLIGITLFFLLILSASQTSAYTIKLVFTTQYDSLFQTGELWQDVNPDDVKDLIKDYVAADFLPFGVSVSTTTGDITVEIGGRNGSLFGSSGTDLGDFLGTPTANVYSSRFSDLNTLRNTNATAARISNALAGTTAHEAAHLFSVYHSYKYDTFDPMVSGALNASGIPLEPSQIPSSLKTDPDFGEHLMAILATNDYTAEEQATVNRSFGTNSTQCINFAANGGANVTINMTWGLDTTFYQQQDFTVSTGKTFIIASGNPFGSYTHHMNNHAILLSGTGDVIKYSGGTVLPTNTVNTRLQAGSNVKVLGKSVQATIDTASSGNTVLLKAGTYYENIDMASSVHLKRSGTGTATINGTVDFTSISNNDVDSIRFDGLVTLYGTGGVEFNGCEFWSGSTYGVSVTNGTPNFFNGCDFWASTDGIKLNNSDPFIDNSLIHGNSRYGIYATNGAEPDVVDGNDFYENSTDDIRADSDCGDIYATDNFWDTNPPDVYHAGSPTSEIFFTPFYPHTKPALTSLQRESESTTLRKTGRRLLREKNITEALQSFKQVVENHPNDKNAQLSLGHVVSAYLQSEEEQQALEYLEKLAARTPNNELARLALFHTIPVLVALDKSVQAVNRADELIQRYPDSRFERLALFNKGFIFASLGDLDGRAEAFADLIKRHPKSDEAEIAAAILNHTVQLTKELVEEINGNTVLNPNYPNPFNPATTISFSLGTEGLVNLTIYNALGQRVRSLLMDKSLNIGAHQVNWDGKNNLGQQVASGIYLYELQVDHIRKVGRMVLAK